MIYTTSLDSISSEMLTGFFDGWPNPPSQEKHFQLLKNSYKVVLALDDKQVVGFITAISDGVLSAYIPLLEVLPAYKNKGIGKELVRRMFEELQDHYMIDLICDDELQPYYEKFGMKKAKGMVVRNYEFQSGR
ncbi:GNAT family N-acetyltransferase [Bacillus luteolus]|uniref:GNAT family N-acetyltransferase n=1 Tax=Litchfieldia luteola TaxID=682179 RepID=A0ABR9QH04_9BACI|nr:GNAT family N-acetyltransferase [Cytobacillus luteolus]MBE4907779.1 GNAT family N-acetyltransferase [Cytobacillus luteolus]MBP1944128.1 ribosomal protein S18 acetylase RimI-like enzyme [Cytobacillus luteolus]